MAKEQVRKRRELKPTGFNVYETGEDNGVIFYEMFSKKAYLIPNNRYKEFTAFTSRLTLAGLCALAVLYYTNSYLYAIGSGVIIFIVLYLILVKTFLKEMTIIPKFAKLKRNNFFIRIAKSFSYWRILIIIGLDLFLTLLSVANAYKNEEHRGFFLICSSIGIIVLCTYFTALLVKVGFRIKTED